MCNRTYYFLDYMCICTYNMGKKPPAQNRVPDRMEALMKNLFGKLFALAAFAAIIVWFVSLVPAALDAECRIQEAKLQAHFQMVRGAR